ncbi:hypothetical protein AVEN_228291-1 [Araneus ventricosus]|uniref:Uncharacterized protein n=1 Tax=Araneus ventricosus TaxID=182803 RepID=A0A4Y2IGN6_ARAVE|nr:hypothetical protein AVEN_228291-1 [Araneus ventricosus]
MLSAKVVSLEATHTKWDELVNDKVSKLFLPSQIQNELAILSCRVCLLLAKFNALHDKLTELCQGCQCLKGILQSCPFWLSHKLYSDEKIVEKLIQDTRLSVPFRFILGCEFLSHEDAFFLWENLPVFFRINIFKADLPDYMELIIRTLEFREILKNM